MIIGSDSGMIDVGGDDGAAARDFLADEFGRDFVRDRCAETIRRAMLLSLTSRRLQSLRAVPIASWQLRSPDFRGSR